VERVHYCNIKEREAKSAVVITPASMYNHGKQRETNPFTFLIFAPLGEYFFTLFLLLRNFGKTIISPWLKVLRQNAGEMCECFVEITPGTMLFVEINLEKGRCANTCWHWRRVCARGIFGVKFCKPQVTFWYRLRMG
jgi:hypothetical protein